jgi:hypothetical protein
MPANKMLKGINWIADVRIERMSSSALLRRIAVTRIVEKERLRRAKKVVCSPAQVVDPAK